MNEPAETPPAATSTSSALLNPTPQLTIAALRTMREKKQVQALQPTPPVETGTKGKAKVKLEPVENEDDINAVIKKEEVSEVEIAMQDIPGTTADTSAHYDLNASMLIEDSSTEVITSVIELAHEKEATEEPQSTESTNNEAPSKKKRTRHRGRGRFRFPIEDSADPSDSVAVRHNLSLLHCDDLVNQNASGNSINQQLGQDSDNHKTRNSKATSSQQIPSPTQAPGLTLKLKDYLLLQKAKKDQNFHESLDVNTPLHQGYLFSVPLDYGTVRAAKVGSQRSPKTDAVEHTIAEAHPMEDDQITRLGSRGDSASLVPMREQQPQTAPGQPPHTPSSGERMWEVAIERAVLKAVTNNWDTLVEAAQRRKRGNDGVFNREEQQDTTSSALGDSLYTAKRPKLGRPTAQPVTRYAVTRTSGSTSTLPNMFTAPTVQPSSGTFLWTVIAEARTAIASEGIQVPPTFSIMGIHNNLHLAVPPRVRSKAYGTIMRHLKAMILMGRDLTQLMNSRNRSSWTCLPSMVSNTTCDWPMEGRPGQYACRVCTRNFGRPCVIAIDGDLFVLPLAPELRMNVMSADTAFFIKRQDIKIPETLFSID